VKKYEDLEIVLKECEGNRWWELDQGNAIHWGVLVCEAFQFNFACCWQLLSM